MTTSYQNQTPPAVADAKETAEWKTGINEFSPASGSAKESNPTFIETNRTPVEKQATEQEVTTVSGLLNRQDYEGAITVMSTLGDQKVENVTTTTLIPKQEVTEVNSSNRDVVFGEKPSDMADTILGTSSGPKTTAFETDTEEQVKTDVVSKVEATQTGTVFSTTETKPQEFEKETVTALPQNETNPQTVFQAEQVVIPTSQISETEQQPVSEQTDTFEQPESLESQTLGMNSFTIDSNNLLSTRQILEEQQVTYTITEVPESESENVTETPGGKQLQVTITGVKGNPEADYTKQVEGVARTMQEAKISYKVGAMQDSNT